MKRVLLLILAATLLTASAGCGGRARDPQAAQGKPSYTGPTESFEQVVSEINRNNSKVPTLWARQSFEATIVDREKGRKNEVVGDGALLYKRPRGFLLKGVRPGMTLFEMGSTEDRYWLTLVPETDAMWWGKYEHLYKPCAQESLARLMPIRPDLVLEVLGVGTIDTNFDQPPVPTMRFNNDRGGSYMFVWNAKLPGRWWAQREVWYDRETLLPTLVVLFDVNGRVAVRAFLSEHQPVKVPNLPEAEWPRVATHYRLFFPETATTMTVTLSDVTLDKNGIPSRRGLRFPDLDKPGVANVIQIDEGCE